jgi:hypothetical protein
MAAARDGSITVLAGSVIKAVGSVPSGSVFYLGQNPAPLSATISETDIQNNWTQTSNPLTTFYTEAYASGALAALPLRSPVSRSVPTRSFPAATR